MLQVQVHELIPGGSEIPVTQHNRQEFVDLMVDWYLSKSVETPFNEFKAGFYSVASGSSLVLFNHHEMELLVCGLPHLDFNALEKAAIYEGGYSSEHPAVKRFWGLLHSLSLEQKKRFLMFVTGSDRAPMGGLGKLRMLIQRAGGDTDRLPTSHTCFNVLLLPEYASNDKMRRMLLTAIENAQGFGLQ
jgi:ubiquitin-protein ligase E3 A